jgi:hypothetical protein
VAIGFASRFLKNMMFWAKQHKNQHFFLLIYIFKHKNGLKTFENKLDILSLISQIQVESIIMTDRKLGLTIEEKDTNNDNKNWQSANAKLIGLTEP